MEIYLIRHGETDYNKQRRLQGIGDIPLNARGIELARRTAEGLLDVPFDKIYTSPLIRAKKTAEIIRGSRDIEIIPTDSLLEISFGDYEGLTVREEDYNIPDPEFRNFFEAPHLYHTPPNGESIEQMRERTTSFIRQVMEDPKQEGKTILMASHGAAIRGILSGLQGLPVSRFWEGGVHKNCAVSLIRAEKGKFEIVFENRVYY